MMADDHIKLHCNLSGKRMCVWVSLSNKKTIKYNLLWELKASMVGNNGKCVNETDDSWNSCVWILKS